MNFLQLSQRAASECSASLTGPSSVDLQTGRLGQIVKWVNAAWMDIQTSRDDWMFMVGSFSLSTTSGDGDYTTTNAGATNFRKWREHTFKIYLASAGVGTETDLVYMDYMDWYRRYNTGSQTNSYPTYFTIDHDTDILLAPKPDGIYTLSGEYVKSATELSGDSDTPELPTEFHMAIVYRAMMKYGRYTGAPEVYTDGQNEYKRMMREMIRVQTPRIKFGGPLA